MSRNHIDISEIDTWRWRIGQVVPGLLIGGDLPPDGDEATEGLRAWAEAGVTDILDVREEWSDEEFVTDLADWMGYHHLGTHDDGGAQSDEWFDAGVAVARAVLDDDEAALLVHCHMGINRGPSMAFAILLNNGWDPIDALDAIRAARPIAAIAYAEDALRWHLTRTGADPDEIELQRKRIERWHHRNEIDVNHVIRRIRRIENGGAA